MSSQIARKVVHFFQSAPAPSEASQLSAREVEVLDLLAKGHLIKEIADRLNIGFGTVRTYIRRIYEKLHVHSRAHAVPKYLPPPARSKKDKSRCRRGIEAECSLIRYRSYPHRNPFLDLYFSVSSIFCPYRLGFHSLRFLSSLLLSAYHFASKFLQPAQFLPSRFQFRSEYRSAD